MRLSPQEAERLALIRGAIGEIKNRPDLGHAAKERGIRALEKAEERLWQKAREGGNRDRRQGGSQAPTSPGL